jgi:hypothetical protein
MMRASPAKVDRGDTCMKSECLNPCSKSDLDDLDELAIILMAHGVWIVNYLKGN